MRHLITCCWVLGLWPLGQVLAQDMTDDGWDDQPDDYEAHFGNDAPPAGGPASLEEARQQRRGYRLGSGGSSATAAGEGAQLQLHTVQEGDTLWSISSQHLGDPWQWPRLWSYNPEITNPHWIYPTNTVRLTESAPAQAAPAQAASAAKTASAAAPLEVKPGLSRVVVVPDGALQPGMVFLRDQGYLDRESLGSLGTIIGAPEEHMVLSTDDRAYVHFQRAQAADVGNEYAVFREIPSAERFPNEQGTLIRIVGTVTVQSYDPDKQVARVIVTEALDVIERGFNVAKVERRFDLVPARPNGSNIKATIIACVEPHGLIGYGDVVFLDVGQGKGVEPGNRFFVVRRGDEFLAGIRGREYDVGALMPPPEYHPENMPNEVVAELRVVKVRKDTSIALVTRSDTDLTFGDVAEMRVGF